MNKAIWKDIEGYEGLYQVSNLGDVRTIEHKDKSRFGLRTIKSKIKSQFVNNDGYCMVSLYKDNKMKNCKVSRLVANTFIPNPLKKETVNHIDGNKQNDKIANLEWNTRSENQNHAYVNGLQKPSDKQKEIARKYCIENKSKKVNQIDTETNKVIKTWNSLNDIQRELGISTSNVSRVCKGLRKQTHGYQWQYVWVRE